MSNQTLQVTEEQWEILEESLSEYGVLANDADNHYANVASNLVLQDFHNQISKNRGDKNGKDKS